jgi:hypothetical protein
MTLKEQEMKTRLARLLAAPVAALALGAGVVAGAPVASASITPSCIWQPLNLINGWQSSQGDWNTGDPEYCVDNSIVYLSGSLKNPSSGGAEFAVLPPQALPASYLYRDVYTYGGTVGQLNIAPNGEMTATGSSAHLYTSLAGVSFPVAGTTSEPLWLAPGWESAQGTFGTGDPGYVNVNGIYHWTGSAMYSSGGTPSIISYFFPQPTKCMDTYVYTYGGHVADLTLATPAPPPQQDAPLFIQDTVPGTSYSTTLTSFAGITFPGGLANWQAITLQPGWGAGSAPPWCVGGETPSYYVQDHVAYLSGEVSSGGAGGFFGTLPLSARPQHDLWLMTLKGYLHISPSGQMFASAGYLELGNISFPTTA